MLLFWPMYFVISIDSAQGQTSSGKTFTMGTEDANGCEDDKLGIAPVNLKSGRNYTTGCKAIVLVSVRPEPKKIPVPSPSFLSRAV